MGGGLREAGQGRTRTRPRGDGPQDGSDAQSGGRDLAFFLTTRFVVTLVLVVLAEAGVVWLETSAALPWLQEYIDGTQVLGGTLSLAELVRWVASLLAVAFSGGGADARARATVVLSVLLMLALLLLPVVVGALAFSRLVGRHVRALMRERDEEHERDARQRNLFLTDVAHDLRTPLMAISGMAHAMLDGLVPSEEGERDYLEAICEKTDRMGGLVNTVFDYAQLGSDGFVLHRECLDLPQLLLREAAAAYTDAEDAGMTLEAMVPEDRCTVYADPTQLGRLVGNLLTNAIRHNPPGTVIVLYLTRRAGVALVYVADTGTPIEGDPERLFQPFARGDEARSGTGGTGLGLSIVARIAQMHGYQIALRQPCPPYAKAFVLQCPVED